MKTQNANNSLIKQLLASQMGLHYMELFRRTNTGSSLTLILLTWRIGWAHNNARK